MSGGYRGTVLLRGVCLICGREVSGGNSESGMARGSRIMLRIHNNPATGQRCVGSRDRVTVDQGLTRAWGEARREAERAARAAWKAKFS